MDAPEKITISKYNITDDGDVVFAWLTNSPDCEPMNHPVEYVRADVFTEKAVSWLKENADHYVGHYLNDGDTYIDESFIEEFRKYMKGE